VYGSAESEHPRLTNGEIMSEEFQTRLCDHNPPTPKTHRRTDRQTDRRHAIARPHNLAQVICTKVGLHIARGKNFFERLSSTRIGVTP